jgi:hypothetical protein
MIISDVCHGVGGGRGHTYAMHLLPCFAGPLLADGRLLGKMEAHPGVVIHGFRSNSSLGGAVGEEYSMFVCGALNKEMPHHLNLRLSRDYSGKGDPWRTE